MHKGLDNPQTIRKMFCESDNLRDAGLTAPDNIKRYDNISYGIDQKWNLLDVYHEKETTCCQPAIISIHGGGWVYGDKERYQYYCMDLAQRGFTVVNFTYRLAPESKFPAALEDINSVFTWIACHAKEYNIDAHNLFVVGDSAGAQLASQYLALLTDSEFQKRFAFRVPSEITVKAAAFNCGVYDFKNYVKSSNDALMDAYFGKHKEDRYLDIDTISHVNCAFPPSYIMTAYYDFLKEYAEPFYEVLKAQGVPAVMKIYGSKEQREIAHVFHLNIRSQEAKSCNDDECAFFRQYIKHA